MRWGKGKARRSAYQKKGARAGEKEGEEASHKQAESIPLRGTVWALSLLYASRPVHQEVGPSQSSGPGSGSCNTREHRRKSEEIEDRKRMLKGNHP